MQFVVWLRAAEKQLEAAGISTAHLDALILAEDCLQTNRALLLAHPDLEVTPEQQATLSRQLTTRTTHEPMAYIRHKSEFYGREFYVDHRVLEPRPETETLIELLVSRLKEVSSPTIVDIGTGSGILAITCALELPNANVIATDIDAECLAVARKNAQTYGSNIQFLLGDLLQPLAGRDIDTATILICNLPYVPNDFVINPAALHEPRSAIFGGPDGLAFYRRLFIETSQLAAPVPLILTEALPSQHQQLKSIAAKHGYRLDQEEDFIQLFSYLEQHPR